MLGAGSSHTPERGASAEENRLYRQELGWYLLIQKNSIFFCEISVVYLPFTDLQDKPQNFLSDHQRHHLMTCGKTQNNPRSFNWCYLVAKKHKSLTPGVESIILHLWISKIYICHKYQKHESCKSNIKMRDDAVMRCSTGKLLSFPERWQHFSGGWLLYYFCIHCPSLMHAGSFSFLKSSSKIKFQNAPFTIGRAHTWFLWIPHLYFVSNSVHYFEMWDKEDTHPPP